MLDNQEKPTPSSSHSIHESNWKEELCRVLIGSYYISTFPQPFLYLINMNHHFGSTRILLLSHVVTMFVFTSF